MGEGAVRFVPVSRNKRLPLPALPCLGRSTSRSRSTLTNPCCVHSLLEKQTRTIRVHSPAPRGVRALLAASVTEATIPTRAMLLQVPGHTLHCLFTTTTSYCMLFILHCNPTSCMHSPCDRALRGEADTVKNVPEPHNLCQMCSNRPGHGASPSATLSPTTSPTSCLTQFTRCKLSPCFFQVVISMNVKLDRCGIEPETGPSGQALAGQGQSVAIQSVKLYFHHKSKHPTCALRHEVRDG